MEEARTEEESATVSEAVRSFCRTHLGIFLTPTGATIAAISFFLPWIRISCLGTRNYSGFDMGGLFWLVPTSAAFILIGFVVVSVLKRMSLARYVVPACTAIAAVAVAYACLTMPSGKRILLVKIGPDDVNLRLFFGAYSTILGFVLAVIGSQMLPKVHKRCGVPAPQCSQTENPAPAQEPQASATT
jgi:hypothetical protein